MNENTKALSDAGVSIWLDDLSSERLTSGSLAALIEERNVVGVTTNPTIFANAIAAGDSYEAAVVELAGEGATVDQVITALTTKDVADACDLFEPVYRATNGRDGRVSIEVEPGLATQWDVSADGLTYTFHLRKGVKFHTTDYFKPTRDFNADDVLFTFNRLLNADDPFRKAYPSESPYFTDMDMNKTIKQVEKVDEQTVRFQLNNIDAAFIQNLAMSFASIQSAEYAAQLLKQGKVEEINQKPIGTGPFVFKRYQKDAQIRYKAHPDYWAGKAPLDRLIFSITPDASVRYQKLKAGDIEVASITLSEQLSVGVLPLLVFLSGVAVIGALQFLFYKTELGRAFRATSDDQDTARLMGVSNSHIFGLAMALAMAVVAIAGVFLAIRTNFDPTVGPARLLYGFEAVIIGGLGSLWGTLAGGIILGVAQAIGAQINPGWQILAGHVVFLLILIFRPRGLFPRSVD